MVEGQRKIFVLGAVFFGGLLAGVALAIFLQAKPEPVRDTSRLRDLLHITAQQEIGVPPLADDANTNDLLTAHPMVYLMAVLFEAYSFIQEPDLALARVAQLRSMIDGRRVR